MTREEQDEKEFEEWLKDRLNDQTVNLMPKAVWLASRRLMRESINKRSSEFIRTFMEGDMEGKDG